MIVNYPNEMKQSQTPLYYILGYGLTFFLLGHIQYAKQKESRSNYRVNYIFSSVINLKSFLASCPKVVIFGEVSSKSINFLTKSLQVISL